MKATAFTNESDKNKALESLTDEIIAYAQKRKFQQQQQQQEFTEPPTKKQIQREGEIDIAAAQIELDLYFKEKVVEARECF